MSLCHCIHVHAYREFVEGVRAIGLEKLWALYCRFPFASNRPVPDSAPYSGLQWIALIQIPAPYSGLQWIALIQIPAPYSGLHYMYGAGIRDRTIRSEWKSTVHLLLCKPSGLEPITD